MVPVRNENPGTATGDLTSPKKRKVLGLSENSTNPKLQEFLDVMQPPSRSKIWANEDGIPHVTDRVTIKDIAKVEAKGHQSDDQSKPVYKKRKRSPSVTTEKDVIAVDVSREPFIQTNAEKPLELTSTNHLTEKDALHVPMMSVVAPSDADWLRSRTSRLLGLVDDDQDKASSDVSVPVPNARPQNPSPGQAKITEQMPDADSQPDAELVEGSIEQTSHSEPKADQNLGTGRLFLRNLSYNATEDELRQHFAKYGIISEVSTILIPFNLNAQKRVL